MRIRRKNLIILIGIVLIISFLLPIASCNKNNTANARKKCVYKDSPWYEGELINVELSLDANRKVDYLKTSFAGADEKYIVLFSDGSYKVNNWNQVKKNSDYAIKQLTVIDRSTKQVFKNIDMYSLVDGYDWPERALYSNGQIIVRSDSWDANTESEFDADYCIDVETGEIKDSYRYEQNIDLSFSGSYFIGEYRIEVLCDQRNEHRSYILKWYSTNGNVNELEVRKKGKDLYGIPVILTLNDTTALVPVALEREYEFYELDLINCKLTKAGAKEYEWLNVDNLISSFNGSSGKVYFTTPRGVSIIDMNNKVVSQVFDYNWCGINRQYLSSLEIAECSDDSFLLCGEYNSSDLFSSVFVSNYAIVDFKKANKNPHAGKKIIELYVADGKIDDTVSDAVLKYNNSNKNYYIEYSDRYDSREYINYSGISSIDDYDTALLNANSNLSKELAIDILNGEGPDILLNSSGFGQLNSDNYLVDLMPYVSELDSNKYFMNIINGAKTGEKLYQIPISYTIEGIQTDPDYAGKSGVGFTTKEYRDFLYNVLNGKDVIESGQAMYFSKIYNAMSDRFLADGKIDFSGSDYKELAEYVKDTVQQKSISWDTIPDEDLEPTDFTTRGNRDAYYCCCPGISGYLVKRAQIKNGTAILGIPSTDGRGPMFGTRISIAISSHAINTEACAEFIKTLLSDDIQRELAMSDNLVINRDAFRQGCNAAINYFNTEDGSQYLFDYAAGTYVASNMQFTPEDIDRLEKVILTCSKSDTEDSAINLILIEEMPAYFLGQKNLDSVVKIAQNRAQKVLDERG